MRDRENLPAKLNHRNWAIVVEGRVKIWYLPRVDGAIRLFRTRQSARCARNALWPYSSEKLKVVRVSVMELEWRCKSEVRRRT